VAAISISQLLTLYIFFPLAAVLTFMLLIARYYQRFASERTFFQWFAVPVVLFGIATMRYASINEIAGDGFGDVLFGVAGLVLMPLVILLYRRMAKRG
jgi:hypothetical protein